MWMPGRCYIAIALVLIKFGAIMYPRFPGLTPTLTARRHDDLVRPCCGRDPVDIVDYARPPGRVPHRRSLALWALSQSCIAVYNAD